MLSKRMLARPYPDAPLAVAYGLGVDSTAMLIEFVNRGIKPDLILFADTGGEKPETYQYLDVIQPYLRKVGFPEVTVVRYRPTRAVYDTLEAQCLHTGTLPSLAYGGKWQSVLVSEDYRYDNDVFVGADLDATNDIVFKMR